MFGINPLIGALLLSLSVFLASAWWFGVNRRRKAETAAGIRALAGMKWRECAGLVLQALGEKGYREAPSSRQPGDGGTEFLLIKGDERSLLSYKHGTAYRLGEANVRDFANGVQLQGANTGILVTLGTAEGSARVLARRYGVELIDGNSLWPQVEPFAPPHMVEDIRHEAANVVRRGQRLGVFASLALGLAFFAIGTMMQPSGPEPIAPIATPAPAPAAATTTAADPVFQDEASRDANAAIKELEAVSRLTDEQRTQRRLLAAARIADLEEVNGAVWSTQSTLILSIVAGDSIDKGVVNDACTVLIEYEELRYTRLQLEAPLSANVPVRWRQCQ